MQTAQHSERLRSKRKMLIFMPLFILPFMTLFFWAIGGGKNNKTNATNNSQSGLNTQLPDAKFKSDKGFDKLSFYQQASKDSAKLLEEKRNDPYWFKLNNRNDSASRNTKLNLLSANQELYNPLPDNTSDVDANEAKVYSKLNQLNKALANSKRSNAQNDFASNQYPPVNTPVYNSRVDQLEAMMNRIKEKKTEDPEIAQLNQMLDKIAAIQHPELLKDTELQISQSVSRNEQVLAVRKRDKRTPVSTLQTPTAVNVPNPTTLIQNAFYSESNSLTMADTTDANAFGAMIAETQTVVNGATVKLSLQQEITVQGKIIPKGCLLYGIAALKNERLTIGIHSIRFGNNILPVSLNVYDMDGLEGIYVPGSISINAAKQSADRVTSGFGTSLFNPSLGAQAANAGIETARTILSKKIKLIKVTLPAGYQVLLKNTHQL
ncbi:conjugative transposon protein TraM [Ilyomonas limi]|uniref:Conjugative transposon protein TraM n=1 Tax=Ilyomonas limi TaxID=2575867 RepID=A0A4U3KUR6_9BACT|nr:conjugative transposon protein TraM [Ilyomonas limi]TKK64706.1 conjugative transposon protein TraM [Ilyomonas limi]